MPSTVIRSATYRPDTCELDILFVTGRRYIYHQVRQAEADGIASAFSKARYFNAHIRDHYDFTERVSEWAD